MSQNKQDLNDSLLLQDLLNNNKSVDNALETFRNALESAAIPLILHAEDGEILLMSKSVLSTTGYKYEDINTLPKFMDKLHKDRSDYNEEFVAKIYSQGITLQGEEEAVFTKTGEKKIWAFHNSILGVLEDGRQAMITLCVDVTKERQAQSEILTQNKLLEDSEAFLRSSINSQKDYIIILLDKTFKYLYFNEFHKNNMKRMYGVDIEVGKNIFEYITVEADNSVEKIRYHKALDGLSFTEIDIYGENSDQYYETTYNPILTDENKVIGVSIFSHNITSKMKELERVKESEEKFRLIYSSMSQGLAVHEIILDEDNNPVDYKCLEVNESYLKLFNGKREDFVGKRVKEFAPQLEEYWIKNFGRVALTGESKYYENFSKSAGKYLSTYAYSPKPGQFAVLISDISERVKKEKEITYLSLNDQLTGLFNRRYYEEKIIEYDIEKYYPLSLIIGDVNGLKLVNDSFGHQTGDELLKKVAKIMTKSCRNTDIITRIGGDEFVIILPNTEEKQAHKVVERMNKLAKRESIESIEVSVSFGYGTKHSVGESLTELFKSIEDDMYRNKINAGRSMRSKTIDLIMTTLYEKNEREMNHSKRVGALCKKFGEALSMDVDDVNQLRTAGLMHDIGKIGIEESILNKKDPLSIDEYSTLYKHSEIGYRILSSVNEFSKIAEYILEHHEKWDGSGYPNNLRGEEIALPARIISIVDAYDAMTGPRTYRDSLSIEEAIKELLRCKGTQFDPNLVDIFIKEVVNK